MKVRCSLLLLSLCLMLSFSCSKIELDDGTDPDIPIVPTTPSQGDSGESSGDDKGDGNGSAEESGYTVSQLASLSEGQEVAVVGYIVGFASGKTFYAGLPGSEGVSSNIVIADTPSPTDASSCAACQLVSGSKARAALNLVDNPNMLKRKVRVTGRVMKYFGAMGLKPLRTFTLLSDSGQTVNPPSEGETDTPTESGGQDKPSSGGQTDNPSGGNTDKPSGDSQDKPSGGEQDKPSGGGSTDNPSKDPDIGEGEY